MLLSPGGFKRRSIQRRRAWGPVDRPLSLSIGADLSHRPARNCSVYGEGTDCSPSFSFPFNSREFVEGDGFCGLVKSTQPSSSQKIVFFPALVRSPKGEEPGQLPLAEESAVGGGYQMSDEDRDFSPRPFQATQLRGAVSLFLAIARLWNQFRTNFQ